MQLAYHNCLKDTSCCCTELDRLASVLLHPSWTRIGWHIASLSSSRLTNSHLSFLRPQGNADRLARGLGLRMLGQHGLEEVRLRVPDYEFFRARS